MTTATAAKIPDEEFLFAVAWVARHRGVFNLGEVGEILVGYKEVEYWAKADELIEAGLLNGANVYQLTPTGVSLARAFAEELNRLTADQMVLA